MIHGLFREFWFFPLNQYIFFCPVVKKNFDGTIKSLYNGKVVAIQSQYHVVYRLPDEQTVFTLTVSKEKGYGEFQFLQSYRVCVRKGS